MRGTQISCKKSLTIFADTGKIININVGDKLWITTSDTYFSMKNKLKIARPSMKKNGIGWDITKSQLNEHFKVLE